ncbi:MAG: pitrilysin family protein [Clostridia bacterium]|jgi:predicted Zn-dependent peptidase|nr:insulinase family protein [Clostridia bacterium]
MKKVKLYDNGLKLVVVEKSQFETVAIAVSIETGSINETPKISGISHYIEHMMFKGTKKRTAQQIVAELDALSANVNAFTCETHTLYHTKSLSESAEKCLEILSDMYFNSQFLAEELVREREVILEEIARYKDIPEAVCEEGLIKIFYEGHPASNIVIGSKESLMEITRDDILKYVKDRYTAQNTIISFAGKIKFEDAEKLVQKYFVPNFSHKKIPVLPLNKKEMHLPVAKYFGKTKKIEQSHIAIAYPTVNIYSKDLQAVKIFSFIFGGGMSSRLFQEIREKRGLVYSVHSQNDSEKYGGILVAHFATRPQNAVKAMCAINDLTNELVKNGVKKEEFDSAVYNLISSIKMKQEVTIKLATSTAEELAVYGKVISPNALIKKYEKVTIADVNRVARKILLQKNICVSFVGPKSSGNLLKYLV